MGFFKKMFKKSKSQELRDLQETYYYKYHGDLDWLERQINTFRFINLKCLLPVDDKSKSNFFIAIFKDQNENNYITVFAKEFDYSKKEIDRFLTQKLELTAPQYNLLIKYLKDTYTEEAKLFAIEE